MASALCRVLSRIETNAAMYGAPRRGTEITGKWAPSPFWKETDPREGPSSVSVVSAGSSEIDNETGPGGGSRRCVGGGGRCGCGGQLQFIQTGGFLRSRSASILCLVRWGFGLHGCPKRRLGWRRADAALQCDETGWENELLAGLARAHLGLTSRLAWLHLLPSKYSHSTEMETLPWNSNTGSTIAICPRAALRPSTIPFRWMSKSTMTNSGWSPMSATSSTFPVTIRVCAMFRSEVACARACSSMW